VNAHASHLMFQERAVARYDSTKYHLKQMFRSSKHNGEAFYFGQRIITAVTLSCFAIIFTSYVIVLMALDYQDQIKHDLPAMPTRSVYGASLNVMISYRNQFGGDLNSEDMGWVDLQADELSEHCNSLGDAVFGSMMVGLSIAFLMWVIGTLTLMVDYRTQVLSARQGNWPLWLNKPKVNIVAAPNFINQVAASVILVTAIWTFVIGLIVLIFWWPVSRAWFASNWKIYLTVLLPALLTLTIKIIAAKTLAINNQYVYPYVFKFWDVVLAVIGLALGLISVLMRFILNLFTMLCALVRVERSPVPFWFSQVIDLDGVSKAYWGMVLEHHTHDNPVATIFIQILWENLGDMKARVEMAREQSKRDDPSHHRTHCDSMLAIEDEDEDTLAKDDDTLAIEDDDTNTEEDEATRIRKEKRLRRNRVVTRFWLALLLHHNPSLRVHRKAFLAKVALALEEERRKDKLREEVDLILQTHLKAQYIFLVSRIQHCSGSRETYWELGFDVSSAVQFKDENGGKQNTEAKAWLKEKTTLAGAVELLHKIDLKEISSLLENALLLVTVDGETLSDDEKDLAAHWFIAKIVQDADGEFEFDEFEQWLQRSASRVHKLRAQHQQKDALEKSTSMKKDPEGNLSAPDAQDETAIEFKHAESEPIKVTVI